MSTLDKLIGSWSLVDFYFQSDESKHYPFGNEIAGMIVYLPNGKMAAQLGNLRRRNFSNEDYRFGKPDEIIESFNQYISYCGDYSVHEFGKFIAHNVKQSLFPNWIGKKVKRYYEFTETGDKQFLKLTAMPLLFDGKEATPTLIWEKDK